MRLLAIDPGPTRSALVGFDAVHQTVLDKAILLNPKAVHDVAHLHSLYDLLVVEKIKSYGMPVGDDIFETVWWDGRFCQAWRGPFERIPRREVKLHLCNSARAKDTNVRQALLDRFGPGRSVAIGTKKAQGPLYGIHHDLWAALAVVVTVGDRASNTKKETA